MTKFIKVVSGTLLSAAFSFGAVLSGVFANSSGADIPVVNADEVMPAATVTVDTPSVLNYDLASDDPEVKVVPDCAVLFRYIGDSTTELTTYMHLGTNINPNLGYDTYYGNEYRLISVPAVGSNIGSPYYYWVQAFVEESDETYSSSRVVVNTTKSYTSKYSIAGSVVSGYLSSFYKTISYTKGSYTYISLTCIYNGEYKTIRRDIPDSRKKETMTVGGITFTMYVYNGKVKVKTSEKIACNQYSATDSSYGAFAFGLSYGE